MASTSRREFLQRAGGASAALAFMVANGIKLDANPLGMPIGSQMWPHQTLINNSYEGFEKVIKDLKAVGVDSIETISPSGPFSNLTDGKRMRKMCDDAGIKCFSAHFRGLSTPANIPTLITFAKDMGMTHMSMASMGGRLVNGVTTLEEVKVVCDRYNKIGEQVKKEGFQLMTHNEGFENSRLIDGRLTYPVLLEYLNPDLVKMQFQMSGMTTVGDPILYFTQYPGRFASAHLQGVNTTNGMRAAAGPPALTVKPTPEQIAAAAARRGGGGGAAGGGRAGGGAAAPAAGGGAAAAPAAAAGGRAGGGGGQGLAVGEDTVDWVRVFEAAKVGGLKNFFVEQNWDVMVRSVAFLKTLNVT
jgi:sugar phosphate isomerase/epimerase